MTFWNAADINNLRSFMKHGVDFIDALQPKAANGKHSISALK